MSVTRLDQRHRRVALVHYWLVGMRGGERVLERLIRLFPEADIFTHVYDPGAVSDLIRSRPVKTSFIQKLPGAVKRYQSYLPLMPRALEAFDMRGYDLVISSESGPAKGVIAAPDAFHLCYCHSPMRYLWDHYHIYREAAGPVARLGMTLLTPSLRAWDVVSAQRIDHVVANSNFIRRRVRRAWGRDADVVFPPVSVAEFAPSEEVSPQFLWVGQMVPYKRPDLAVDAFTRLKLPLLMIGDGPMLEALQARAGPTIRFLKRQDFAGLKQSYATCRALVFTAEEDFGIVPVEANASGRPVIAYGRGGALDSIAPGVSGLFFAEQSVDHLMAALEAFAAFEAEFDPLAAVHNATRFAPERFDEGIARALARA